MKNIKQYQWATHQPLIKVALDLYKPDFILELGIGENSTPIFSKYVNSGTCTYVGVENDKDWIALMQKSCPFLNFIYHNVLPITGSIPFSKLTVSQKVSLFEYYKNLNIPVLQNSNNLLFVDQYASTRALSINILMDKFDVLIVHDVEPKAYKFYMYNKIDFTGYDLHILESPTTSTLLVERKGKGTDAIKEAINKYLIEFKKEHSVTMQLKKFVP